MWACALATGQLQKQWLCVVRSSGIAWRRGEASKRPWLHPGTVQLEGLLLADTIFGGALRRAGLAQAAPEPHAAAQAVPVRHGLGGLEVTVVEEGERALPAVDPNFWEMCLPEFDFVVARIPCQRSKIPQ